MATQTSLVAQQVRIRQWAEQIRNCQNRPKGMDVETWCTQNNLTKANYYYRLRRVRQICLDHIEYSCAMKSHFRKFGNQMSGSGNHLCNYASLLA